MLCNRTIVVAVAATFLVMFMFTSSGYAVAGTSGIRSTFPIPPLARTIAGVTISTQTGQAVAGAKVVLIGNRTTRMQKSDSNGWFQFDGLAPGTYMIQANGGPLVNVSVAGYDSFVTLLVD